MSKFITVFSLLMLAINVNVHAAFWDKGHDDDIESQWISDTLHHDDLTRHYRYLLPITSGNEKNKLPVVILLHGGTRSMNVVFNKHSGASRYWPILATKEHFILVAPNGVNVKNGNTSGNKQNWNDCRDKVKGTNSDTSADDVGFINNLIDKLSKELPVDMRRIYISGASNGGMMTYRVSTELSHKVAAAAVFIANEPNGKECNLQKDVRPVPLLIMNGTKDKLIPWHGGDAPGKTGQLYSTSETLKIWAKRNHIDLDTKTVSYIKDSNKKDGTTVEHITFKKGKDSTDLQLVKIVGGGHNVPSDLYSIPKVLEWTLLGKQNRDINGVKLAWDFLKSHSM